MRVAVGIGERLGVAFIDTERPLPVRTPRPLLGGVVNVGEAILDADAQVAAGQIDLLAVTGRDQPEVAAKRLGNPNRDNQLPVHDG